MDENIDSRLREVEGQYARSEGQNQERWTAQFLFNEKLEGRMIDVEACVNKHSTNLKVNNVKMGAIFTFVQIVIMALVAAVAQWLW